jgi:hypothetical protein
MPQTPSSPAANPTENLFISAGYSASHPNKKQRATRIAARRFPFLDAGLQPRTPEFKEKRSFSA